MTTTYKEIEYNEVFQGQEDYRIILESFSRPGLIKKFKTGVLAPPKGLHESTARVSFALFNKDLTCAVLLKNKELIEAYLKDNTAVLVSNSVSNSWVILADGNTSPHSLESIQVGDPNYPESGSFLFLQVETLGSDPMPQALACTLQGPGVNKSQTFYVAGLNPAFLEVLQGLNSQYPLGIDTILCDNRGSIVSIPRSSQISIKTK